MPGLLGPPPMTSTLLDRADSTAAVALGDVNGDSFLDIVFGNDYNLQLVGTNQNWANELLLGDGAGGFTSDRNASKSSARCLMNGSGTAADLKLKFCRPCP